MTGTNGDANRRSGRPGTASAQRLAVAARRWRSVHIWTGVVVGIWFIFMAVTGVLVNHQADWGLDEIQVNNRYLPSHYTDEFHPESTSLNAVLSDLHSGRFLGEGGRYLSDLVGLLILISVASGYYSHHLRRRANALGIYINGVVGTEALCKKVSATADKQARTNEGTGEVGPQSRSTFHR